MHFSVAEYTIYLAVKCLHRISAVFELRCLVVGIQHCYDDVTGGSHTTGVLWKKKKIFEAS